MLASLQTAARVAAAREDSLQESLNSAMADASRSNTSEIELRALEREATAQRDLLESFLGRYREAVGAHRCGLPAGRRAHHLAAVAPRNPSYPKKAMMSVVAAIAVFLIVVAILLLREFTSGRAFRVIGYGTPSGPVRPFDADESEAVPVAIAVRAFPAGELRPSLADREPPRRFAPPAPVAAIAEDDDDEPATATETRPSTVATPEPGDRPRLEDVPDRDGEREPAGRRGAEPEMAQDADRDVSPGKQGTDAWRGATDEAKSDVMSRPEPAKSDWRETEKEAEVADAGARVWPAAFSSRWPEPDRDDPPAREVSAGEIANESAAQAADIEPAPAEPGQVAMPVAGEDAETAGAVETAETESPAEPVAPVSVATDAVTGAMAGVAGEEGVPAQPAAMPAPKEAPAVSPKAETREAGPYAPPGRDPPGTAELATIVAGGAVRVALFAGAEGGEGAGEIAYATARQVAREKQRCVVLDIGARRSPALARAGRAGSRRTPRR